MDDNHTFPILPFISVVVPALNCSNDVQGFATAIRQQDYPADRFEVIVVDNGSTDDTLSCIQAAGLIALQRAERGRARALNMGVAAARGEIVMTTDLSCRPEPYWIRSVAETFSAHPDAGCVAGEIRLIKSDRTAAIDFQDRNNYMSPLLALSRSQFPYMPFADGANASFRKCLFDQIGGFEESFFKAADVEICYRMFILSDYTLVFNRAAVVWESGEPTLRALLYQRYRMGLGTNLLRKRFPSLYGMFAPDALGHNGFRSTYWSVRNAARITADLIELNVRAVMGRRREAAIDTNIRVLMGIAQSLGSYFGGRWLARKDLGPKPVDETQLKRFLSSSTSVLDRVRVVEICSGLPPH